MIKEENKRECLRLLEELGCSCVIASSDGIHAGWRRGVADLHACYEESPELLRGAFVADKVVGKAAAALLALGRVEELHARVLSRPAAALLRSNGIRYTADAEVPHIINRKGTDWCPLEKLCDHAPDARSCLPVIRSFLETMAKAEPGRGSEKRLEKVSGKALENEP